MCAFRQVTWTGQMLGELMEVLVSCEDYSTSQELLKEAAEKPQTILGFLPEQSLSAFLTYAVAREDAETAVAIVLYAQEAGHMEAGQMALKLRSALPLTPQLRARVASALGGDLGFSPEPPINLNPLGES
ncbi:hypothetical protein GWK47_002057 [Chionoecetes opilio]|uniref:Uncharacterized protein n=1 Tax=Chionoecetes opilio TaxID=41210 RepID=A0A8J5BY01_CHIOP|nr:hypothetical protein GWK47_002057 [Chionoecetes opilio]